MTSAPRYLRIAAVAVNVSVGTMTSSPGPIPHASAARCKTSGCRTYRDSFNIAAHELGKALLEFACIGAGRQPSGLKYGIDGRQLALTDGRAEEWYLFIGCPGFLTETFRRMHDVVASFLGRNGACFNSHGRPPMRLSAACPDRPTWLLLHRSCSRIPSL